MYKDFYGLRELPFELTPNPRYLYLTRSHHEALSNLQYGLSAGKALTLLVGEAGTGKTTLLRAAVASEWCRHVRCVCVNNPTLTRDEFIEVLARAFDLGPQASRSKTTLLAEIEQLLRERGSRGETTALVVDEAQSLSAELLEEIRLLSNLETATEKLLPLVLAGQPELSARLEEPGLRQLKQRVALRCELTPFGLKETAGYIASRIRTAGGEASRMFTKEAVMLVHECSHGVPRMVNVMCDNALVNGFALGRRPVDRAIVLDVSRDFRLSKQGDEGLTPETAGAQNGQAAPSVKVDSEGKAPHAVTWSPGAEQASRPRRFAFFGSRRS